MEAVVRYCSGCLVGMRIKSNFLRIVIRYTSGVYVVSICVFVFQTPNGRSCGERQEYFARLGCLSRAVPNYRGFLSIDTESHAANRLALQSDIAGRNFKRIPLTAIGHATHITLTFCALHSANKVIYEVLAPERSV